MTATIVHTDAPKSTKPVNPYAETYEDFIKQTQDHELKVISDNGLYKHLRIQAPGTRMWSWDIVTWPGYLATSGDIADGYMFNRERDMIEFFNIGGRHGESYYSDGAPSIDIRYWAEKLSGGRSRDVKVYDSNLFLQLVTEALEESEDLGLEAESLREQQLELLKQLHELRGLSSEDSEKLFENHWDTLEVLESSKHLSHHTGTWLARRDAAQAALYALWSNEDLEDAVIDELVAKHNWHDLADIDVPRQSPQEKRKEILSDAEWHADSESEAYKWLSGNEEFVSGDTWEWNLREALLLLPWVIGRGVRVGGVRG